MINNVIFDLSEVLIPGMIGIEEHLAEKTGLHKDRITKALGSFPHYEVGNILDELLKGKLTYEQYRTSFLLATGLPGSYSGIFDAECMKMFEKPYGYTEELLTTVARSCNIFLLSDHCEKWASWIKKTHPFLSLFKDIVWSYEIGATKREAKPFEIMLQRNNLNSQSCLFVDDLEKNIRMAETFGMKTVHFMGYKSVQDVYAAIGLGTGD